MEKRRFGKTDLQVSVLGFGGAPIGFLHTEQKEIERILHALLDHGCNVIDTAAMYQGSEDAIGKALGNRRGECVLISKCPNSLAEPWTAKAVRNSVDRSLQRLQTDVIDVMLLHTCSEEILKQGDVLDTLVKTREAGKVRFVGFSGDNQAAAHAVTIPDIAVIETSINICDQGNIDSVLPLAQKHDIGVIVKRPIANAAWKNPKDQPGFYAGYSRTYTERLQEMKVTPAQLGFSGAADTVWPEIALRFTLSQPGVHTAIIGTTNPDHVNANLTSAAQGALDARAIDKLREAFRQAEQQAGDKWLGLT